jgi:hypothetical protein
MNAADWGIAHLIQLVWHCCHGHIEVPPPVFSNSLVVWCLQLAEHVAQPFPLADANDFFIFAVAGIHHAHLVRRPFALDRADVLCT